MIETLAHAYMLGGFACSLIAVLTLSATIRRTLPRPAHNTDLEIERLCGGIE